MTDPVLLKKVAQIYIEGHDAFWDAFIRSVENAADRALREWGSIEDEPRFLALANEFGRDAALAALREVRQIGLECLRRTSDRHRSRTRKQAMTRAECSEIKAIVQSLGAPFHKGPDAEHIMDGYILLATALDLAKDVLSDESAPEAAKVLAQAVLAIARSLELQRLRALDDLGPPT